jgi:hypothetical protein
MFVYFCFYESKQVKKKLKKEIKKKKNYAIMDKNERNNENKCAIGKQII